MEKMFTQIKPDLETEAQGLPKQEKPLINRIELNNERKKEAEMTLSNRFTRLWSLLKSGSRRARFIKITGFAILLFLLVVGILGLNVYRKAVLVKKSVDSLVSQAQSQSLPGVKNELQNTKKAVDDLRRTYKTISWLRFTPVVGTYVADGNHVLNASLSGLDALALVVETVEPYADIIGFSNGEYAPSGGEETAQDRLDFVIKTIPDLVPKAQRLSEEIVKVKEEVDKINPERYPKKIFGFEIRSKVRKAVDLVDMGSDFVINGKPLLESAPYILGSEGQRTYLILFQNDKELRPTGGFITAYSIARVNQGRFEPVSSNDIYNLDLNYKPKVRAPDTFVEYLKGPYVLSNKLRLRDMNWSPDFARSMELFIEEVETVGVKDIDGIIAVDTQLLVNLLEVLGTIGVPGFGNFGTEVVPECNCPQVIYELESFADVEGPIVWSENEPGKIVFAPPNYENRKKIIGPLMNSILANAMGQPKEKLPGLFAAVYKSLLEKHVLFYLLDDKAQEAVESFGIAGKVKDYEGDYLYINDANLGGRKSNLYVTQEVLQEVLISKEGSIEKTLTITYKNPEKHDGWLNSVLPNWVRIYVPKDSELISVEGLEVQKEPYEELGKKVFAGFFSLRPEGVNKVTIKYKVKDVLIGNEYRLLTQKQPGKDSPLYVLTVGKEEEEFFLKTDREFKFKK